MKDDVERLIAALEQLDLSSAKEDTERLASLVLQRQEILGRLQSADVMALDPGLRSSLKQRIHEVLRRDQALLDGLVQIRERTRESLDALQHGRSAARGYAQVSRAPTTTPKRIG